jgi:hypothetical protein
MRTLDALQLAIAMELADGGLVEQFVCSDKSLCRIASMAGLNVLDPEDPAT